MVGLGVMIPAVRAYTMGKLPRYVGGVASLTGLLIALFNTGVSFLVANFHAQSAMPLSWLLVAVTLIAGVLVIRL